MLWVVLQTADELSDGAAGEADLVNSGEQRKPGETREEGEKDWEGAGEHLGHFWNEALDSDHFNTDVYGYR